MRITKVYTRTGDKGTTRLVGGQEIAKDHLRIECFEFDCGFGAGLQQR